MKYYPKQAHLNQEIKTKKMREEAKESDQHFKSLDRAHMRERLDRERMHRMIFIIGMSIAIAILLLYAMHGDQVSLTNGYIH